MGYRTVTRVPSIFTYAQAKQIYDNSVPIRNRSEADSRRPLGARRDADTYHIRMNGDDVECVLYSTPVITFHPDNTITIRTDNWNTVSTHQFIRTVTKCVARSNKNKTVIGIGHKEYVVSDNFKLKHIEAEANKVELWEVLEAEEQFDYQINKQKANEVRKRYKEFTTYLNSSLKLRTVKKEYHVYAEFSYQEMVDAFGVDKDNYINKNNFMYIDNKHNAESAKFIDLISSQGDNKTENYYRAMLILVGRRYNNGYGIFYPRTPLNVIPKSLTKKAQECIYKWHSDEVFEKIKLPLGKVPKSKYDSWV